MKKLKTIIVMPAYNAEATLEKTIADIPFDYIDEIILVDDASHDNTVALAHRIASRHDLLAPFSGEMSEKPGKKLFTIVQHQQNKGYGGNQKKCYNLAIEHGADIIIMLHPDYQYDPKLVKYFVEFIRDGYFDVMLGSRIRSRQEALAGGMPPYKYYANRLLSFIQNVVSGRALSEWHTGMRAYRKEVLESLDYENFSDDFVFDSQVLFGIVKRGYTVGDIPVPVRYFKEASSINFRRSVKYGLGTLWETSKYAAAESKQIFRFVISGLIGASVNIGSYAVLIYGFGLWYITAAIIAFSLGIIVSFTLQKFLTFENSSLHNIKFQIAMYLLLAVFNISMNGLILYQLVQSAGLDKLLANIISNSIVATWSFFVYKYALFRNKPQ